MKLFTSILLVIVALTACTALSCNNCYGEGCKNPWVVECQQISGYPSQCFSIEVNVNGKFVPKKACVPNFPNMDVCKVASGIVSNFRNCKVCSVDKCN